MQENLAELIGRRIHDQREEKNISTVDLARQLGTSRPTIVNWESGKTVPDVRNARAMCDLLGLSPSDMLGYEGSESNDTNRPSFTKEEANLIKYYHKLEPANRRTVNKMILSLVEEQDARRFESFKNDYILIIDDPTPAAAGTGCDYSYEEPTYTFVRQIPANRGADHLIHVSGHSMEPFYQDGDIVYVRRTKEIVKGRDYICDTADGRVIKRAGDNCLYSLNRDLPFPDKYEDDHVTVFGQVLGILKPDDLVRDEDFNDVQTAHMDDVRAFKRNLYAMD
ncbi:MAG: LexA family transcriptional regulator [Clostridia bacterium]|nr:LexA family transcriptional regulator [Clostridia bacterium]